MSDLFSGELTQGTLNITFLHLSQMCKFTILFGGWSSFTKTHTVTHMLERCDLVKWENLYIWRGYEDIFIRWFTKWRKKEVISHFLNYSKLSNSKVDCFIYYWGNMYVSMKMQLANVQKKDFWYDISEIFIWCKKETTCLFSLNVKDRYVLK